MKYLFAVAALAAFISAAVPYVHAQADQFRPPQVPVESWIPMGAAAGFVVVREGVAAKNGRPGRAASGFFMGLQNGEWVRLDFNRPSTLEPAG